MQTGRFMLAVVLMIATVVVVNIIFPPPPPRPRATPTGAQLPAPDSSTISGRTDSVRTPVLPPQPSPQQAGTAPGPVETPQPRPVASTVTDTVLVESALYRYGLSTQGAALVSAELLKFKSETRSGPVQLAPNTPRGLLSFHVRNESEIVDFSTLQFSADRRSDLILRDTDQSGTVRFTALDPNTGRTVEVDYTFVPLDYRIDVAVRVTGVARAGQLFVDLGPTLAINEAVRVEDERALAYVVNATATGIHSVPLRSIRPTRNSNGVRTEEGPLSWIALKNKYFVVAAVADSADPANQFGGLIASPRPGRLSADLAGTLSLGEDGAAAFTVYAGPQDPERLAALGRQLEDVNPYGWRWLRPVIRPLGHAFGWMLLKSQRATGLGYGWVLILFGVAVRLALWPLNAKAMRSQLKGMELQPRIKDIQTKYKDKPEDLQREMLKLYREEGFNPMGGCLPLLLPMPVLITLFFVFQGTIEFRGVPFLWLPDLSRADPYYILPALLGATMFLQQWISTKSAPPNPQAKMLMYFMPAFMVILFLNFASGLNLYYMAQNITGFPQQWSLMKERERQQARKGVGVVR